MPEGLAILANQQTRGRGRLGWEFYSPPDTGVYMSILLRPRGLHPTRAVHITTMAAVAACAAIGEQSQKIPQIKWGNDILPGGKKVCGILTEGSFNPETDQLVVQYEDGSIEPLSSAQISICTDASAYI